MATATSAANATATATATCDISRNDKTDDKTTHSRIHRPRRSRNMAHAAKCNCNFSRTGPHTAQSQSKSQSQSQFQASAPSVSLYFEGVNAHARPSCQHINFICISARRWFRITNARRLQKLVRDFPSVAHFWPRLVPWPTLKVAEMHGEKSVKRSVIKYLFCH